MPIRSIEARSGISFGKLACVDPLAGEEEGLTGVAPVPLLALEQIRVHPLKGNNIARTSSDGTSSPFRSNRYHCPKPIERSGSAAGA